MGIVDAVEDLEKAKSKLDDLRLEAEETEKWDLVESTKKWDLVESLEDYIRDIQSIIDALTDDEQFASKPVVSNDEDIICDHAETCTQRLVMCEHQKPHNIEILNTELQCTDNGYCSVAEIECKCIKKGE